MLYSRYNVFRNALSGNVHCSTVPMHSSTVYDLVPLPECRMLESIQPARCGIFRHILLIWKQLHVAKKKFAKIAFIWNSIVQHSEISARLSGFLRACRGFCAPAGVSARLPGCFLTFLTMPGVDTCLILSKTDGISVNVGREEENFGNPEQIKS